MVLGVFYAINVFSTKQCVMLFADRNFRITTRLTTVTHILYTRTGYPYFKLYLRKPLYTQSFFSTVSHHCKSKLDIYTSLNTREIIIKPSLFYRFAVITSPSKQRVSRQSAVMSYKSLLPTKSSPYSLIFPSLHHLPTYIPDYVSLHQSPYLFLFIHVNESTQLSTSYGG